MKKIIKWAAPIVILIGVAIVTATIVTKTQNNYDVNKDGEVDSLDLLELRKYLIGNME